MQDTITTVYCVCEDLLRALAIGDDQQSRLSNAEIMMTPIVAALYFTGKIERAHIFLHEHGYIRSRLSKSRLNRRLHLLPLEIWRTLFDLLGQVFKEHNSDKLLHRRFDAVSRVRQHPHQSLSLTSRRRTSLLLCQ